jgi:hypothetical protein
MYDKAVNPSRSRLFPYFLLGVILLVSFLSYQAKDLRLDDAMIYARYVSNAMHHHGFVYNPGQRVNALTSPLFTYLLFALSLLTRNVIFSEYLLCGVALVFAIVVVAQEVEPLIGTVPTYLTGLIIASTTYFYSVIGMETSLFLLMLALCYYAFRRSRYMLLGVLLALTMLTRPEGGLMLPVLFIEHRRLKRANPNIKAWIAPVVILLTYVIFNISYYGHILPDSAAAKFGQGSSGAWGRWPTAFLRFYDTIAFMFGWSGQYYVVVCILIFGAIGCWSLRNSSWGRIYSWFCIGLALFYILFNLPAYHWYYGPLFFYGFWFMAAGLMETIQAKRWRPLVYAFMAILAISSIAYSSIKLKNKADSVYIAPYYSIAEWLKSNTAPNVSVASAEIGVIGYYSERPTIDILGLTDPGNAKFIADKDNGSWLSLDKPDYVVMHDPAWPWEQVVLQNGTYEEVPWRSFRAINSSAAQNETKTKIFCILCTLRRSHEPGYASISELLFSTHILMTFHPVHQTIGAETDTNVKLYKRIEQ